MKQNLSEAGNVVGILLVVLSLGGVCAYVWSAIVQAETQQRVPEHELARRTLAAAGALAGSGASALRRFGRLLHQMDLPGRVWTGSGRAARAAVATVERAWAVALARRARRAERTIERSPRRLRFHETAVLTVPISPRVERRGRAHDWVERPSRWLAAAELALLIVLLAGVMAAAILGAAQVFGRVFGQDSGG